jgi:hypothetical protein
MPHAIQIRQTGGPEVLNWTLIEVGEPGSGQVRLRQAAAGLNYIDVYHRTGYYSQPLPFIPGLEGAGTVEVIGQDVRDLKVGDRVAYCLRIRQQVEATSDAISERDFCIWHQWLRAEPLVKPVLTRWWFHVHLGFCKWHVARSAQMRESVMERASSPLHRPSGGCW